METLMGKGPGRIELAIEAAFDAAPDDAFTTSELCQLAYPGINAVEKKHRVAVLRAVYAVMERRHWVRALKSEGLGGGRVFFDSRNVMAYAMAHGKADAEYEFTDSRKPAGRKKTALDLRRELEPGGRYHKHIIAGGAWWEHVQSWRAEADAVQAGDDAAVEAVLEQRAARKASIRALLRL